MQEFNDNPPQETTSGQQTPAPEQQPPAQEQPQPQTDPQDPYRHATRPDQMAQPPRYGHSGYYQQTPPAAPQQPHLEEPPTLGDWMITLLLMHLPIVNIIMLFVWAFGGDAKIGKSNWAKAQLIWMGIGIVFVMLFYGMMIAVALQAGSEFWEMFD